MYQMQQVRNQQFQQILSHHQEMAMSMSLPNVQVPTFKSSDTRRLFYLVQYTSGEVQDLVRSCLSMKPQKEYKEARRLLKEKYGQNYKIATTYVDRIDRFPSIKAEGGHALQQFSVLLI